MEKDLDYWKKNAEEDYMKVPISVLRYITELEKAILPQADVVGRSEQLPCDYCEEHRPLKYCQECWEKLEQFKQCY